MNILCNFIPHELIVCDEKDPPSFNTKIKLLIHEKMKSYKVLRESIGNNHQIKKLKSLQNRLKCAIDDSKHNCYLKLTNKLLNVQRNSKPCWFILKTFLNNKKVPIIPSLFHENEFVIDCYSWTLFISFFAKQCSLLSNSSKRPSRLHYFTEKRLSTINFWDNEIFDTIQQLDPNKAHSHEIISARMLNICGKSIWWLLELTLNECISKVVFHQIMFGKLPSCHVVTNLRQNPRTFGI